MIGSSVFVLAACLCVHLGGASLCKPYSTFVIDCNNCTCSKNGMEYSCTNFVCPPIKYEDKYDVKIINGGYKVLVPKNTKRSAPNEEDSALNPKKRVPRVSKGFPYINDEIPSSREMEKHIRERSNNDIDERYNNDIDQMDYSDDRDSYGKRYSGRNRNNNDIFEGGNNDIEDRDNSDIDERRYMGRRRYNDIDENEDEENDLSFDEADEDEDSEWMSEEDNYNDDESNYIDEDTDRNRRGRYRRKSLRSQPYKIRK